MDRLVVGLLAALAIAAPVPTPPAPVETVSVTPTGVTAGDPVFVSGTGFDCGEVSIGLDGSPLGTAPTPLGTFGDTRVLIPPDTVPGRRTIEVACPDDVSVGYASIDVRAPIIVPPPPDPLIVLTPDTTPPGAAVTVTGSGFDDCVEFAATIAVPPPVDAVITIDGVEVARTRVGEDGAVQGMFSTTFLAPDAVTPVPYLVTATCTNRDQPGTTFATGSLTVMVSGGGTGGGTGGSGGNSGGGAGGDGSESGGGSSGGSGGGIIGGLVVLVAVVGVGTALLRRRPRPRVSPTRPSRLPDVRARPAGMRSGVGEVRRTGAGHDVAVRVVARGGRP